LPPRYLAKAAERERLSDMVREALSLIDGTALSEGVSALEDMLLRRGRCSLAGRLVADAVDAGHINARTWVERSHPLYSRVLALNDGVALQFAQSLVPAGQDHRGAMLYLSRRTGVFQVGDIPDIAEPQQIELARKLLVDGFLIRLPEA
jgi:bifunctional lysine-specific demethylase and histidyl-hydroxylase NO66